nr:putative ribonuclease H-like domain-containing protein [Tanacetum cinerariifolium]
MKKPKSVRLSAPIIEDWESDDDGKFVLNNEGKATGQRGVRTVWNNAQRVNHQNFANNLTHPHPRRNFVPTAVITNSGKVLVNTAKQSSPRAATTTSTARHINTAATRPTVNAPKNSDLKETISTAKVNNVTTAGTEAVVSDVQGNEKNVVKSSACWIWRPTGNIIDHISKYSGSYMLKRFNYVDLQGRLKSVMAWSPRETNSLILYARSPNLDFMRPFGCPVTILNTLDHRGMFEGKVDEGFLVGYSVNITTGNQTNDDAGIEINVNARKARQEKASDHEYILLPFMPSHSPLSSSIQSSDDTDTDKAPGKGDEGISKGSGIDNQERFDSSTQDVNTVEPSINISNTNINSGSLSIILEVGAEADTNNLELSTVVSPIPITNPNWIEAMQEGLMQFKLQKVWTLVDLPNGKRAVETKWVFRNKKDKRGIVVRNKARLVAQGYTQEEGIDYDEVFAPVARIEAIRLFLSYASFMGFIAYQMDVKSVFSYDTIEEAWYEILSTYLLENGFRIGNIDKTLFIKKGRDDIILVQVYVDDIIFGSTKKSLCNEFEQMMHKRFQMSSMGELTFFLGLQVKQKVDGIFISQDKYVAGILKKFNFTTVKTASTPMEPNKALIKDVETKDVDVYLYRSMIGSLMFLTTSRPDIMFDVCACARFQVTPKTSHLHIVKRISRYLKGQPKLGLWYPRDSPFDLEAFFDSDYAGASLDTKSTTGEGSKGFHQIVDFLNSSHIKYALTENPTIYTSLIQQFWQIAVANNLDTREVQITATIDGNVKLVYEAFIRMHLKLEESDGISTLPNTEIFEQLALMGNLATAIIYLATNRTFNFSNMIFEGMLKNLDSPLLQGEGSTVPVESHHTPLDTLTTSQPPLSSPSRIPTRQKTEVPQPSSSTHTHVADEAASTGVDVRHGGDATTVTSLDAGHGGGNIDKTPSMPYDSPLPRVNTLESDKDTMTLNELTVLCTKLSQKVESLEVDLKQTKKVYGASYTKLITKVNKLEKFVKSSQVRRRAKIVVSDDEELTLKGRLPLENQLGVFSADKVLAEVDIVHTYTRRRRTISTASGGISTSEESVSTAGASMPVSTTGMVDKGKAIMQEYEPELTTTKLQQRQERAGYEAAVRLQEQLDEEERQRISRVHEEASSFNIEEWKDIQATIEADEELALRIQAEEREKYSEAEKARLLVDLINQRKRHFAQQRAEERRNKPMTQAQQRTCMSNYVKHMGSHTLKQLKKLSFEELKNLFKATMRWVKTFTPMESDFDKTILR